MTASTPTNEKVAVHTTTESKKKKDEKSGNVRVVTRVRPLAKYEIGNGSTSIVSSLPRINSSTPQAPARDPEFLEVNVPDGDRLWFEFDAVLDEASTQEAVYVQSGAKQAVCNDLIQGFNCTILAYGQTGSGKTFTMGTAAGEADTNHEMDGVIPRACNDLFDTLARKCDGNAQVTLSYLEIYNEEIRDLMSPVTENNDSPSPNLRIRETLNGGVYVSGLESRIVTNSQDVGKYMEAAGARRVTACTKMNAVSSRSHAICVLTIQGVLEDATKFQSKMTLVDLAGSERIKKTGAEGNRRQEGININKGLFVLGQVVSALAEQRPKYKRKPPYRDSKLTRLLQDSLGGNSQTIMIACVSPANFNAEETLTTLRYATSARNIKNTATRNVVQSISPEEGAKLQRENQLLKAQILELESVIKTMTMEAFEGSMISVPSCVSLECDSDDLIVVEDPRDEKIKELTTEVDHLKAKLAAAKINIRKSCMASAIELPALKVQVECLEEELIAVEDVQKDNEALVKELEEVKADAQSAKQAAIQMSKLLDEQNIYGSVTVRSSAKEGNIWVPVFIVFIFQIVLTIWGLAKMNKHSLFMPLSDRTC
eukprot:CAMPEP_0194281078 /NCGR_PEP_ID=MMETSP0169-20130528/19757_1 /TAXON_ID=218684 /ORGANISM="Corethron pennatum, Strain L29A3" /LENGTH=596 /DNA_ID=CAMNT_0039026033 /DNA_START=10 /DNA_END=1797 /DNA_ORIENTATION=+